MNMDTTKDMIIKPLIVGALASGATKYMHPDAQLIVFGTPVSFYVASGLAVGAGSMIGEMFHDVIFPHIPRSDKWSEPVSALVSGVSTTVGNTGIYYAMNPKAVSELGMSEVARVAIGSEVLGSYIYEKLYLPSME